MKQTHITGDLYKPEKFEQHITDEQRSILRDALVKYDFIPHLNVDEAELRYGVVTVDGIVSPTVYTQNFKFAECVARIVEIPELKDLNLRGIFKVETFADDPEPIGHTSMYHFVKVADGVVTHFRSDEPETEGTVVHTTVRTA